MDIRLAAMDLDGTLPVSYTHLDVYKRQIKYLHPDALVSLDEAEAEADQPTLEQAKLAAKADSPYMSWGCLLYTSSPAAQAGRKPAVAYCLPLTKRGHGSCFRPGILL